MGELVAVMLWVCPVVAFPGDEKDSADLVKTLLNANAKSDRKHESEFFRALTKLAEKQVLQSSDYLSYDSGKSARSGRTQGRLTEGKAVALQSAEDRYVVAILGNIPSGVPGAVVQQLLLLDQDGKILDRVGCNINSRYGGLQTEVPEKREGDGAAIVIRFVPHPRIIPWHNWHTVASGGQSYTFYVHEAKEPEWLKSGLVRLAIRKGKFRVLWPKLQEPDAP